MFEFSFDINNLLIKEKKIKVDIIKQFEFQKTRWNIIIKNGAVDKDKQTQYIIFTTGHSKVTKIQENNITNALKILRNKDILI